MERNIPYYTRGCSADIYALCINTQQQQQQHYPLPRYDIYICEWLRVERGPVLLMVAVHAEPVMRYNNTAPPLGLAVPTLNVITVVRGECCSMEIVTYASNMLLLLHHE